MAPIGRRGGRDRGDQEPSRTEEWLAVPNPPGETPAKKRVAEEKRAPGVKRRPKPPGGPPKREEVAAKRQPAAPKRREGRAAALEARIAELEAAFGRQAEELERIASQALRAERRAEQLGRKLDAAAGEGGRETKPDSGSTQEIGVNGETDLNAVDFAVLRDLGLSIAESARLLAIRDIRGGFKRPEELDDLDFLAPDRVAMLKAHLRS